MKGIIIFKPSASAVLSVLERCFTIAAYGCKALGSGPSNIAPEKWKLYSSVHNKKQDWTQGLKKVLFHRPGQVFLPAGQVTFHFHLPHG